MPQSFRLAAGELAFAMAHAGNVEAAFSYLQTVLGEVAPEQFNDWMTGASHSLIARNLLSVRQDGSYGDLDPDLQQVTQTILLDERTLRCHRVRQVPEGAVEQFVSVLFGDELLLAHWIEHNVVAVLEAIPDRSDAFARIALFAGAPVGSNGSAPPTLDAAAPQTIATEQLGRLRREARTLNAAQMAGRLQGTIDASWRDSFAAALTDDDAVWGDVLRIERVDGEVTAERGFLFVAATDTAWLLRLVGPDAAQLQIVPGTQEAVARACDEVLQ